MFIVSWFLLGLIPAHAGKTLHVCEGLSFLGAHPRSRGENMTTIETAAELAGSSPLTRGKLALAALPPGVVRLIPAHAGKTRGAGLT